MDCTICTMGSSRIRGFSASCSKAVSVPEIRSPGPDGERTSTSGSMCADPRSGRALQRRRMPFAGLQLHHGLRGGCAAPESEPVAGATPLPGRLACHGGGLGCARHPNPLREVAPGPAVPCGKAKRQAEMGPVSTAVGDAVQPTGQPVGRQARHLLEAALDTLPDGPLAGANPAAAGGRWGCPAPSSPVPIEARRNGGALPATSEERGSAPAFRRTWPNCKRASDLHDRGRVRPSGDFVSGDPQNEPDTQDLPPTSAPARI